MSEIKKPEVVKPLDPEDLEQVNGGSALDEVPVVDEHDYDEEIRKKVNP